MNKNNIPKHDELRVPTLEILYEEGRVMTAYEIEPILIEKFGFPKSISSINYDSGRSNIFFNRLKWAISGLFLSGMIDKPKNGLYVISEDGEKLLASKDNAYQKIKKILRERKKEIRNVSNDDSVDVSESEDITPDESLIFSAEKIKENICEEILKTIISKSPRFFENLVIKLLQSLGYGGGVTDSGFVTQYVNDQGIDGIIKEDVLGLGRIHVQAKRYALNNGIGREDIQKFVGALAVAKSNKGVFITTSYFTNNAEEYVNSLNGTVQLALIDGKKLSNYMYDTGLGLKTDKVIKIMSLDSDYWDITE